MKIYLRKLFGIFDGIISQRLQSKASSASNHVRDVLLNLTNENDFEWICNGIKYFVLVGNTSNF